MTSEPPPSGGDDPAAPAPTPAPGGAEAPKPPAETEPAAPPQEHHLHPAATLIVAVRHVRAALFGLLAVVASQGLVTGLIAVGAVLVLGTILAVIRWRVTVYSVVDGSLHLRSGLLQRKENVVPASRISALDTSRGILQRVFGVVALHVQTAGGQSDDLELSAVSFAEAERLRRELGHRARDAAPVAATFGGTDAATGGAATARRPTFVDSKSIPDDGEVVYEMTPGELFVSAITNPSIAVVGAAAAGAFSLAQDLLPQSTADDLASQASGLTSAAPLLVLLAVVGVVVVVAAISIVGTVLLYGGFKVTRDEERLRVRRGLLTERVGTIPLDRVHGVRVIESPLRQLLGYASVEAEVAGYAGQDEVSRVVIPLVPRSELAETLARVVPTCPWPTRPLEPVPHRARRRFFTVPLLWAALPAAALALAPIGHWSWLGLLPVALALVLGRAAATDAGWLRTDHTLALRWRVLGRKTVIAVEPRLQRAATSTNPFQRRADLATLHVRLSSRRGGAVRHLDAGVAHDLLAAAVARSPAPAE